MRVLITGAAGFVATNLIPSLCNSYDHVIGVDSFDNLVYSAEIKKRNLARAIKFPNFSFYEQNLSKGTLPRDLLATDAIINLAALPGQLSSWSNLGKYIESNLGVVANILSQLDMSKPLLWIQASTSSVYGSIAITDESSRCEPSNPYGTTKMAAENLLINFGQNFPLNYVILRYFSLYGPFQRPDMGIHKFLESIQNNSPLTIYGDGNQTRGFTYIDDAIQATTECITNQNASKQIFNVSGGIEISVNEIIDICESIVGKKANVIYKKRPIGDQLKTNGISEKTNAVLRFNPKTSIQEGIAAQWENFKAQHLV